MHTTHKKENLARIWCVCMLLMLGVAVGHSQTTIGLNGTELGGVEPWDIPLPEAPLDTGLARRIAAVAYPYLMRMDARETLLSALATNVWVDPANALNLLEEMQPELTRDILAIAALVDKHAAEVSGWEAGIASNLIVGAPWTDAALGYVLNLKQDGTVSSDPVARRHWLAAAWAPVAAGLNLSASARQTVAALGLSPAAHAADPAWSWLAFLAVLRRSAADADARVYAAPSLQTLLGELQSAVLAPHAVGDLADAETFHNYMEALIGCNSIAGLFRPELLDRWALEGGDFIYDVFCAQAGGAVRATLGNAVLSAVLGDGFVWQEHTAEAVMGGYEIRAARYAALARELSLRLAADNADVDGATRLYGYYLKLLARFPPCLSPFRAEQVNDHWLKFVEDNSAFGADVPVSQPETDAAKSASPPIPVLCLLQSDAWQDEDGLWQWRPRAAGRRHRLDQYLKKE